METREPLLTPLPVSRATNAYDLLSQVIEVIRETPARLDMRWWVSVFKGRFQSPNMVNTVPSCGTVACIAGWCAILTRIDSTFAGDSNTVRSRALELLSGKKDDGVLHRPLDFSHDLSDLFGGRIISYSGYEIHTVNPGNFEYVPLVIERIQKFQTKWENRLKRTRIDQ